VNAAETHGTENAKTPTYRFTSSTAAKSFQYAADAGAEICESDLEWGEGESKGLKRL
jgi:hypothetical protein